MNDRRELNNLILQNTFCVALREQSQNSFITGHSMGWPEPRIQRLVELKNKIHEHATERNFDLVIVVLHPSFSLILFN